MVLWYNVRLYLSLAVHYAIPLDVHRCRLLVRWGSIGVGYRCTVGSIVIRTHAPEKSVIHRARTTMEPTVPQASILWTTLWIKSHSLWYQRDPWGIGLSTGSTPLPPLWAGSRALGSYGYAYFPCRIPQGSQRTLTHPGDIPLTAPYEPCVQS